MTDNEIKKALECCIIGDCQGCVYGETDQRHCRDDLMQNALDLINRQQAEIETLKAEADKYYNAAKVQQDVSMKRFFEIKRLKEENESQQAEIERLKLITTSNPYCVSIGTADIFTANHEEHEQLLANIKAEAIKEFEERLKQEVEMITYETSSDYEDTIDAIDKTYKEMAGE